MIDGEPHFVAKDICDALDIKDNTDVIRNLRTNYESIGVDVDGVVLIHPISDSLGRLQETNVVTETGLYDIIQQSRKPNALKFKYWISSEVLPSIRKTGSYSLMPKSFPEALRLYANELEMKELALKQRDEAVKTKAWISDKKTATVLAHTSVLSKQNEKLKEQIGDSKTYKAVTAIKWLNDYFDLRKPTIFSQIGKQLSKLSSSLGYESRKIADNRYGEVNVYHTEVIDYLKSKIDDDKNMLRRFRKLAF
jgi:prophage antirepressor-like protein